LQKKDQEKIIFIEEEIVGAIVASNFAGDASENQGFGKVEGLVKMTGQNHEL